VSARNYIENKSRILFRRGAPPRAPSEGGHSSRPTILYFPSTFPRFTRDALNYSNRS
jgi:hypothetical protein